LQCAAPDVWYDPAPCHSNGTRSSHCIYYKTNCTIIRGYHRSIICGYHLRLSPFSIRSNMDSFRKDILCCPQAEGSSQEVHFFSEQPLDQEVRTHSQCTDVSEGECGDLRIAMHNYYNNQKQPEPYSLINDNDSEIYAPIRRVQHMPIVYTKQDGRRAVIHPPRCRQQRLLNA